MLWDLLGSSLISLSYTFTGSSVINLYCGLRGNGTCSGHVPWCTEDAEQLFIEGGEGARGGD